MIGILKNRRTDDGTWVRLDINDDLGKYLRRLFLKTFGIKLQRPSNDEHITIVCPYDSMYYTTIFNWYENKPIEFDIEFTVFTNGNAFWVNVFSETLANFRKIVPGIYNQDLHFCIGYLSNGIVEQN